MPLTLKRTSSHLGSRGTLDRRLLECSVHHGDKVLAIVDDGSLCSGDGEAGEGGRARPRNWRGRQLKIQLGVGTKESGCQRLPTTGKASS